MPSSNSLLKSSEVADIGGEGDDLATLGFHELRRLVEFGLVALG